MTVGEALAEARGVAGLSVDDVSERTRIRQIVIHSIERDEYETLGGDLYVRGYLRAIAGAVGVDPQPLIREFDASRQGGSGGWPALGGSAPAATAAQPVVTVMQPAVAVTEPDAAAPWPEASAPDPLEPASPEPALPKSAWPEEEPEPEEQEPEFSPPAEPAGQSYPFWADDAVSDEDAGWSPAASGSGTWPGTGTAGAEIAGMAAPAPDSPAPDSPAPGDMGSADLVWLDSVVTEAVLPETVLPETVLPEPRPQQAAPAFREPPSPRGEPPRKTPPAGRPRKARPAVGRSRARGWRRISGIAVLGVAVLAVIGVASGQIVTKLRHSGAGTATARSAAAVGTTTAGAAAGGAQSAATAPAGLGTMTTPAVPQTSGPSPTPRAAPARYLAVSSVVAFGPEGAADGDNPGAAAGVLTPDASRPWATSWYVTPEFGMLKHGTGLLLDMGEPVTVASVRIQLGSAPGADLQIRAGDTPSLSSLAVRATASDAGGTVTLHTSAHGRYILIWFTKLPLLSPGRYQVSVYSVAVTGHE